MPAEGDAVGRDQEKEKRIRDIASDLSASMKGVPSIFDTWKWHGRVMAWAMEDEAFKVRLLRFIDVLPALKTDDLVIRLFQEYFGEAPQSPPIIRYAIERLALGRVVPGIASALIRKAVTSLAGQFIAGRDPGDAFPSLASLASQGAGLSVDLLGEEVLSDSEAVRYADQCLGLLRSIARLSTESPGHHQPRIAVPDISLKVSSFYSQMEPLDWEGSIREMKKSILPVFRSAGSLGMSITFDMEHYYNKDLTIALFREVVAECKNFRSAGIALQAYLKEAKDDLLGVLRWAEANNQRVTVRLVKGAYWDYETVLNQQKGWPVPVFLDKAETDRNFEELTGILFENTGLVYPAIATHNIRSISHAIAAAEDLNIPKEDFEFQTLYGMGEPVRRALASRGMPVRVYCPVGELIPGMAYLVRRILENTSIESFLRKSLVGKASFENLIKRPAPGRPLAAEASAKFRNEPATDFSKAENRQAMRNALVAVRKGLGKKYPLYIGDREIFAETEIRSVNPARPQEVVGRISAASREDAAIAIIEANKACALWAGTYPETRAAYLFRAAAIMRQRRFDLAALEVYEVGKPVMEADADVAEAIDYLEYYGRQMKMLAGQKYLGNYPGEVNAYRYEPRGVAVVISPWNFPLAISSGMASAAIVTGNCAILKPSSRSPVMAWQLIDIFRAAGLPPGVLQYLPGAGGDIGEYLTTHPGTDTIAFTGSKDVGLKILKLAGDTRSGQKGIKRVIAEMGGKNAIIVDDTADLDEAVKGVLESSLGFQGQKCSACSRVIVLESAFSEFCGRLKEAMKSIVIGPPEEPATYMGPLIDGEALTRVQGYIEKGRKEGKVLLVRKTDQGGYFMGPVILEVGPEATVAQEEIFGPVIAVIKAKDFDWAIAAANGTAYALTGGIFSRSPANIEKACKGFRAGNLYINRKITGALVGRQPFGGLGMSGIGSKAGGPDYLLQFMTPVSICENTLRKGFAPLRPNVEPEE